MNKIVLSLCVALVSLSFTYVPFRTPTDAILSGAPPNFNISPAIDTLPPIRDRQRDFITDPNENIIDLKDPAAVEKTVEYDPATGRYIVRERIGEIDFRPPTYLTFDEYFEYRQREDQRRYFNNLAGVGNPDESVSIGDPLADIEIDPDLINNLFGGMEISIQPQGSVDLSFGLNYQYQENPFIVERFRRNTIFDFDMDIQMNVTGQIGDKLKLNTNYNTGANFNFDNQIKLDYNSEAFGEDDIIRNIEAGDVSLPLRGTLIEGAQSLFGLKTELQFGHLRLTAIASQQRSQRENLTIQGGSQLATFEVYADEYDENRHFFLSHYNREVYEHALEDLPQINTLFHLENIEVWITNDRNEVLDVRDIVAFADLAEPTRLTNPDAVERFPTPRYQEICDGLPLPENGANDLYSRLVSQEQTLRDIDRTVSVLQSAQFGLEQIRDFEKVSARKLSPREYTVHPELGFISLNINVQPDQVVAVSYRYKYNGNIFKVGELSVNTDNTSSDTSNYSNQVLITKLLKSSTQRVSEPAWDLMMKNVYSLGAYQVNQEDFQLDIQYENPGQGFQRFLPVDVDLPGGTFNPIPGVPLIRALNLDRLNTQGDPQPDGIFDFVPGITINPATGRVYFPVLEPFGSDLGDRLPDDVENRFVYQQLYDSTLFQAREFPEKNRFAIRGSYKSSVQSEISLGAFNIPPGSVRVTAGGALLIEGRDYTVDYSTGRVRILNDAILSSGVPINVSFEDNTIFSLQTKTMLGLRADYEVNDNLAVGATFLQLFERPFTQKVNIGEDPINNRIYGFDATFNRPSGWLTRTLDQLPFFSTKAPSNVSLTAETAILDPGHSKAINLSRNERGGIVYLDDFEGTASPIDLMTPAQKWYLASVPQNDAQNNNPLFPEADQFGLVTGANRAGLNWYRIDQSARDGAAENNVYTSIVPQQEVFPFFDAGSGRNGLFQFFTFDLSFNPIARGPYNFDTPSGYPGLTAGAYGDASDPYDPVKLLDPASRWGGIMREMTTTDFQSSNIEFVEFWMLSPFLDPENARQAAPDADRKTGTLYLNLGNVSEDILRDSRKFFENGLPTSLNPQRPVDETVWGRVPVAQQITQGFDNEPASRRAQDVGLDGLDDTGELEQFADYFSAFQGAPAVVRERLAEDVSNDNFYYFNNGERYPDGVGLLTRYKSWNNTQGNSAANDDVDNDLRQSATNLPDDEDLNQDNTLNESESYFQYEIPFVQSPVNPRELDVDATPFVTDRIEAGNGRIWYRFRVPLNTDQKTAVGGIQDFRSIRFMRMFMRGFEAPTVLRFAEFELVRNSWRRYNRPFETGPIIGGEDNTEFFIDAVNIEENSRRNPFNYVLPNGIRREQSLGLVTTLQNEQSLALKVENLQPSDSRAVFKYTETDLRLYEELKMFVHAEATGESRLDPPRDGQLRLFLRMGSDFEQNYYEYEVPLALSDTVGLPNVNTNRTAYADSVWLAQNDVRLPLELLTQLKLERNNSSVPIDATYEQSFSPAEGINHTIRIRGNPNLGFVKVFMIGVRNEEDLDNDGVSAEIWVNELRLEGLDERGGVAAIARADVQLADLGNLTAAVNYSSVGFGGLDNSLVDRNRFSTAGFDLATTLSFDRFLPTRWGVRLPVYLQHSRQVSTPEYDPYDYDIKLADKLDAAESPVARDSIREQAQEIDKITAINLNNIGIAPLARDGNPSPLDPGNISVSYGFTKSEHSDPYILNETTKDHTAAVDYTYSRGQGGILEPFKGIQSKYLRLLSEFNLNPLPNSISITNVLNRRFSTTSYRFAGVDEQFNTFFNKRFTWNRNYNVQWNLTRSLRLGFNATMNTTIDEIDENEVLGLTPEERDRLRWQEIWDNLQEGGRPKAYTHTINASYQLPLRYLPFLDFLDIRTQYLGNYSWAAAPLQLQEKGLGNLIQNSQQRQVTADLNFERFYDQIPFLRGINQANRRRPTRSPGRAGDQEASSEAGGLTKALVRPLLALRRARFNYSEDFTTIIPGFLPEPRFFGLNDGFTSPGWGFVAGIQPTIRTLDESAYRTEADYLYDLAEDGYISNNPMLSQDVIQNYTKQWEGNAVIEPFTDFRLEVTMDRSFSENYTETFKVLDKGPNEPFQHVVPVRDGSLTFSNGGALSLFNQDTLNLDNLFSTFRDNRLVISQRRGGSRPHQDPDLAERGYRFGYGPNQQEVLIPAFLAAYRGEDPNTVSLDPFDLQGAPNWRLTWNGLSRIGTLERIFRRVNISHGFQSTFTISSYGTSLDYLDALEEQVNPVAEGYDTISLNFFPRIEIPNISEAKSFAPLLSIDAELVNGLSVNFAYTSTETRSINIVSKLLSESVGKQVIGGFGIVLSDVQIGFLQGRNRGRGEDAPQATGGLLNRGGSRSGGRLNVSDLDIQFNFSLRDEKTYARRLELPTREPVEGARIFTLAPSVEYQLNQRMSLRTFFDYRKTVPFNSLGFPQTTASGGIVVRFQLN
ncbi:protein involved in gliding motility SprA [Neolewinella xylanilytica]|uniref:Protein involved in gliding motility SprA n=1 Tax=Neolewinella xylanilytica TaxID=1514080 RepID=A0A2S6I7I4_9BACT|nr:cell surface protein SprA [Neolewinella xylanilytica]PPK87457.1 protein involved in gliding motility SprA [Neolewinella xylanilytica]